MTDQPTEPTSRWLDCPAPVPVLKVFLLLATCWAPWLSANELILTDRLHHLRNDETQEWSSFPEHAEASSLELSFTLPGKPSASTLRLRQQDVKQTWKVFVNGTMISKLQQDENDMVRYLAVPGARVGLRGGVGRPRVMNQRDDGETQARRRTHHRRSRRCRMWPDGPLGDTPASCDCGSPWECHSTS